jgi:2-isopropylmalate synthase
MNAEWHNEMIYEWNPLTLKQSKRTTFPVVDETLRDGLQSPSIINPSIEDKLAILHNMVELGIECAAIGMPGGGRRQYEDTLRLAREIADSRLPIEVYCLARTRRDDINPILEISQCAGIPIEVTLFLGSSPIRQYVEGWTRDQLLRLIEESVTYTVSRGSTVLFFTEDTTRSTPEAIRSFFTTAIRSGARRLGIADTVGHATPEGAAALVRFIRTLVNQLNPAVKIDWHGHRDRGFALANSFSAWAAGADRCHGTAMGIGERSGNTPIEILLINLSLMGVVDRDLTMLPMYTELVSRALGVPIPANYPLVGADAFRTSTGIHAAAISKARARGDQWLADRVYSGVPATMVGRRQEIVTGPMSGAANIRYILAERQIPYTDALIQYLLAAAKQRNRILTEHEIDTLLARAEDEIGSIEPMSVI